MRPSSISKILSLNDTGETGAHQAGMLIPKGGSILEFFPQLNAMEKNPRRLLEFMDEANHCWRFNYIYYNNRLFGGTRNEYRLTGLTSYIRQYNLKAGDTIFLMRTKEEDLIIKSLKSNKITSDTPKLYVTGTWKVVKY